MEPITQTTDTRTDPEGEAHPIKSYLKSFGFDVTEFPVVRFLIETSERPTRTQRISVPIRLPNSRDEVYESSLRVTGIVEIPSMANTSHRKFANLEWTIESYPVSESDLHPAQLFLANEVFCPSCRTAFAADLDFLDQHSAKISCPQCLTSWICQFDSSDSDLGSPKLLLDMGRRDPKLFDILLKRWTQESIAPNDSLFFEFFPYSFEKLEDSASLEWLFGGLKGWSSLAMGQARSFDDIIRSFLNQIAFDYVKTRRETSSLRDLNKTDIQAKENVDSRNLLAQSNDDADDTPAQGRPLSHTNILKFPRSDSETNEISAAKEAEFRIQSQIQMTHFLKILAHRLLRYGAMAAVATALAFIIFSEVQKRAEIKALFQAPAQPLAPKALVVTPDSPPYHEAKSKPLPPILNSRLKSLESNLEAPSVPIQKEQNTLRNAKSEIEPKSANDKMEADYRKGMLHLKFQQSEEAIAEFEKVLKHDRSHALSYRGLGLAYTNDQKFGLAIKAFEKYLKITKDASDKKSVEDLLQKLRERATAALDK